MSKKGIEHQKNTSKIASSCENTGETIETLAANLPTSEIAAVIWEVNPSITETMGKDFSIQLKNLFQNTSHPEGEVVIRVGTPDEYLLVLLKEAHEILR